MSVNTHAGFAPPLLESTIIGSLRQVGRRDIRELAGVCLHDGETSIYVRHFGPWGNLHRLGLRRSSLKHCGKGIADGKGKDDKGGSFHSEIG